MIEDISSRPEFLMSLLLFVALAGYLIASRINQSAVVGLILVGVLVGPSALNLIGYSDFVSNLAHMGAVILLFVIGLEFKIHDIMKPRNGVIALIGVILPWIGGYGISILSGFSSMNAIFIGTALTATSVAITANVLQEMDKLQTEAAHAIIGAAVIDDVLGLLALAISTDAVSGSLSPVSIILISLKAVAFVIIGALTGIFVVARLIERIDNTGFMGKYPEFTFIVSMMMAFFYAMMAEAVGLSAIVGAFIAGVSFNGIRLTESHNLKKGAEYFQIVFSSIFFVSLGIMVNIRVVTIETITFLVVLVFVAIITKVIGCGIPAFLLGMSAKDSCIVGFGMAPRGEVAMIVGLIGLQKGIIDQGLYITIILMSLLTTLFTPLVYKTWLFRDSTIKKSFNP